MRKELDNQLKLLENNASVSKALDILVDVGFFTYAYMVMSTEVFTDSYKTDNKSEVLKGATIYMEACSNLTNIILNKEVS